MNLDSERIYPDKAADGIEYEPLEWALADGPFVRHIPTFTMWRIGCDEDALKTGKAALTDFYSQLCHACDSVYAVDDGLDEQTLIFLGRGAIAFYLQAIGAWKPEVVSYPDTPKHREIKAKYPKQRRAV